MNVSNIFKESFPFVKHFKNFTKDPLRANLMKIIESQIFKLLN